MKLSAVLISSVMLVSVATATERSPDWDKYEIYNKQKKVSYSVSACMAKKTLKIKDGKEHSYAEPFYRSCMIKHGDTAQKYSAHFKLQTIGRFHYILKRTDEALAKEEQ
jgi:hypothetical protein